MAIRFGAVSTVLAVLALSCATRAPMPTSRAPNGVSIAASVEDDSDDDDESTADGDADGDLDTSDPSASAVGVEPSSPCPTNMVLVSSEDSRFCIDKYEASLIETDSEGNDKPYPHWLPVDGHVVRAVSVPDVFPQGFISEVQADDACVASGKRLCTYAEWKTACMGPNKTTFPYGNTRQAGTCHDTGKSAVAAVFGVQRLADPVSPSIAAANRQVHASVAPRAPLSSRARPTTATRGKPSRQAHVTKGRAAVTTQARKPRTVGVAKSAVKKREGSSRSAAPKKATSSQRRIVGKASARPANVEPSVWSQLNDPRLGQVEGALSKTGSHAECESGFGAVDMMGNLHEWVKTDPQTVHGTFAGGYYLDTSINGDGCQYKTQAHAHDYHDYSTGFRCCASAAGE